MARICRLYLAPTVVQIVGAQLRYFFFFFTVGVQYFDQLDLLQSAKKEQYAER